ncbi:hypothetical protein [Actinoplanes lobatus]|uniref:Uncharacterized protein n=1 Tax=Actinoplanes lobatus TaxID=113568 RepID=A0A7W7HFI2_9ACTN|nr:hypothetical protein [Actinoplanes lobatus]MBB4749182.1 hypothetical protein [Actinoplanes lobatus]
MTPAERTLRARIAANTSWGKTVDRTARTEAARKALHDRFETQVPAEITDPQARAVAAENLRKAHYQRMALRSAQSRARNRV